MARSDEALRFSWVLPEYRILAVLQPKCASSSFLWGLSELAGNDPESRLRRSVIDTGTLDQAIYDPWVHRLSALDAVAGSVRQEALRSPDWMRLGVTRDPYARFYSAWENRVFLPYADAPAALLEASHDVMVEGQLDLGASFRAFVSRVMDEPRLLDLDHHFRTQVSCLAPSEIDYTDLVDVHGVGELGERIARRAGRPFSLPRANEGLGISWRAMFDDKSADWLERQYHEDFTEFGYERVDLPAEPAPQLLPELAVRLITTVRQRDERIRAFAAEGRRSHLSRLAMISLRRRVREGLAGLRRV